MLILYIVSLRAKASASKVERFCVSVFVSLKRLCEVYLAAGQGSFWP